MKRLISHREVIVEFPSKPIHCGECGQKKGIKWGRFDVTELQGW